MFKFSQLLEESTQLENPVQLEDNRPEAGYWARQMAASRAMRRSDDSFGKFVAAPDLIGERVTKGLTGAAIGGLGGAGLGALIGGLGFKKPGIGALLGGLVGGITGNDLGQAEADRSYLSSKGITPKFGGLDVELDDEAKLKYLLDKYQGGGYTA